MPIAREAERNFAEYLCRVEVGELLCSEAEVFGVVELDCRPQFSS